MAFFAFFYRWAACWKYFIMSIFLFMKKSEGIATSLKNLSDQRAWLIKDGTLSLVFLSRVQPTIVAMKKIELRLDYERVMQRLLFQSVKTPEGLRGAAHTTARGRLVDSGGLDGNCWAPN